MTDTTPLSPAAQAVLDALHTENSTGPERYWARANAVAALRAVADQVVPPEQERLFNEERPWDVELGGVIYVREQLLTIANELEAH